jgi:glycosyltransferase involved in cell wall biosynthesis
MTMPGEPLVSVLTPVYNGEKFLAECIESVLKQTYQNYEYIIVNNCSKDRTLEMALSYAKKDTRIRVHNNENFVGVIENHNIAFRLISPNSKYCKVVSADDWLFPACLARMVNHGEAHPSVGIISSYHLSGGGTDWRQWRVRWAGLPYPSDVVPGRDICRLQLLDGPYVFGTPTSILYRSDLVRSQESFYPNSTPQADTSACYRYLRNSDFGFIHEILSYERVHDVRITATADLLNVGFASLLNDLQTDGPYYLTRGEVTQRQRELLDAYYEFLAASAFRSRGNDFWTFHKRRLEDVGHPLDNFRLAKAVILRFLDMVLNPKKSIEKLARIHESKVRGRRVNMDVWQGSS